MASSRENGTLQKKQCRILSEVERIDCETFQCVEAMIYCFSREELDIETNCEFKPGECICISLTELVPDELSDRFQLNYLRGIVTWSDRAEAGGSHLFRAGVALTH